MKRLLTLLLVSLMAFTLAAAGAAESKGDTSLDDVVAKGTFILGLDDSFPPMGFRDENNEIVGFDIDTAREVASRMGVELVTQPIDWNSKEQELATGNIDCIWNGFTVTPEREKVMIFSEPYLRNAQVVVVRGDSDVNTLEDLAGGIIIGFSLAVLPGSVLLGGGNLSPQGVGHQLAAVADAQHRHAQLKNGRVHVGGLLLIYAVGAAGKNDADGLHGLQLLQRGGIGLDLAVHPALTHPAGNELVVLTAEVQDDHGLMGHASSFFL